MENKNADRVRFFNTAKDISKLTAIEQVALSFMKHNAGATRGELKYHLSNISGRELQNLLLALAEKKLIRCKVSD